MKRTPTTYTTLECMAREIRRARTAEAVEMLGRFVARVQDGTASKSCDENRRLRADVRRLRKALRDIARPRQHGFCNHHGDTKSDPACIDRAGTTSSRCDPCVARAALARRRRKS